MPHFDVNDSGAMSLSLPDSSFASDGGFRRWSGWPYLVPKVRNTLPTMVAGVRPGGFIGREAELDRLWVALEERAGSPGLFVAGEAGLGKTRLLHEFADRAVTRGAIVAWGGCLESGAEGLPFSPFVEALGWLHERLGAQSDLFMGPDRAELAAFIPELGLRPSREPERIRLYEAVRNLFDNLGDPAVLVIEDIHWADRSSLELISYLVRRLRHGRTLLVATFRSEEVGADHPAAPVIAELTRTPRAQRIDLVPLPNADLCRIVSGREPGLPSGEVTKIAERACGNPFFAEALAATATSSPEGLSATLRDLLLLRVMRCSEPARDVLDLVAVAGRPVGLALIETAWDGRPDDLDRGLADAIASGLLVDQGCSRLALQHALIGEAIEARLQPRQRRNLHERLANLLAPREDLAAPTEAGRKAELARHWLAAGRDSEALAASIAAAEAATRVPARLEARAHYEHAVELWDRVPDAPAVAGIEHTMLLCRAAEATFFAGDAARAVVLESRAAAQCEISGDQLAAGVHYATLADLDMRTNEFARAEAEAKRALDLIPAHQPSRERALALWALGLSMQVRGRPADGLDLCERSASIAHAVSAVDLEARARSTRASSLWAVGHEDEALAELDRAVDLAEVSGDARTMLGAHLNRLVALAAGASDPSELRTGLTRMHELVGRLDVRGWAGEIAFLEVEYHEQVGDWDVVEELATDTIAAMRQAAEATTAAGDDHNLAGILTIRGKIRILRGRADEGESDIRETLGFFTRSGDRSECRAILALAALARRLPASALDESELAFQAVAHEREAPIVTIYPTALGLRAAADLAEWGRARRDKSSITRAEALGARYRKAVEAAVAGTLAPGMGHGRAVRAACAWGLAEASRLDGLSDPALWADAVDRLRLWWHPDLVPYAHYRLAEAALLARDDRSDAADALRTAHARAHELGMLPLLDDIESLARRARIDLGAPEQEPGTEPESAAEPRLPADPYGLSAREREVVALLAEGRTNREIGELLFISEKTASVHVTHILNKLAVNSRGAAAVVAARAGLVGCAPQSDR